MLEPPEGGAAMHRTTLGSGGGALPLGAMILLDEDTDIDAPVALQSTAWHLAALRAHYHPVVAELAAKLATQRPLPPKLRHATPLALMETYSGAGGTFHPPPPLPKPRKAAATPRR